MRNAFSVFLVLIWCVCGSYSSAQDVATVGSVTASGTTVVVPFYVRDVSGTALGRDQVTGNKIQALSFRVSYSPSDAVSSVTFTRGGITAALTPLFETSTASGNTISYIGSFNETTSLIPFTLDQAVPGDQVLQLTCGLSASATPGTVIALTIETSSSVTLLSNQAGTVSETASNGRLTLVNGTITVPATAPTVTQIDPSSGTASGGTSVTITGSGFQAGATVVIGGVAATGVSVSSATSITATTGAHSADLVSVMVTNPDGQSGTLTNGYTYLPISSGSTDLSISKASDYDTVAPGGYLIYSVTVLNTGPDTATGVAVSDPLPAGVSFHEASMSQGSYSISGTILTASFGTITSGSSAHMQIVTFAPSTPGQVVNTATVSGGESDPNTANNSATAVTTVVGNTGTTADLSIVMTDSPDPVTAGSELTYTVAVSNAGPDTASDVSLTDVLPAAAVLVSASASQGSCTPSGNTLSCDIGTIGKGAFATVTILVRPTTAGQLTNTVIAGGSDRDPNTADNTSTAITAVETGGGAGADLTGLWKRVKRNGSTKVSGRFTPRNVGSAAAGPFTVAFYFSSNDTVDGSDKLIRTSAVSEGLTAGASGKPIKVNYTSKRGVTGRYLIAVVDAGASVGESNETNNAVVKKIQ